MINLRTLLLTAFVVATMTACAASPTQPSSTPGGGLVDTPEEAIAAVVAKDPRFAGIQPYRADLIGQSAWYKVTPASGVGAYVVQIQVGWGDCQAGCIDKHTWTFAVLPDGSLNMQSETGAAIPPNAWPQPTGAGQTGIAGRAVAGPVCPVETVVGDPACAPRPVSGAVISILDGAGMEVSRGTTAADGTFFVAVGAGDYTIRGAPVEGLMGEPPPVAVTVADGATSTVDLPYDTGIR